MALLTLVLVWLAYLGTPAFPTLDTLATLPIAISLLEDGDFELGESVSYPDPPLCNVVEGRRYSFFAWGPGVAAVPIVAALRLALGAGQLGSRLFEALIGEPVRGGDGRIDPRASIMAHRLAIERLVASSICVVALALLWSVLRSRHSAGLALAVVLAIAFGSSIWTTCSRALFQHGPAIACGAATLWTLVAGQRRRVWFTATGAFAVLSYVMRPTGAVVVIAVTLYMFLRQRRYVLPYLAAAGLVGGAFLAVNLATYGKLLPAYYSTDRLADPSLAGEVLAGLLVSPARGLFVYSPFLLLAPVSLLWQLCTRRLTALDGMCWGVIALHSIVASQFEHWWGGDSWGPRLMADLIPFLAFVLLPEGVADLQGWRRSLLSGVFGTLALAGVAVNSTYLSPATHLWNNDPVPVAFCPMRAWEWRDPPFTRGTRFDGRREPMSAVGDALTFRDIGPIPGFEGPVAVLLPPGRYGLVLHVHACQGLRAGLQWRVTAVGPTAAVVRGEGVMPEVQDGSALDLTLNVEVQEPTQLRVLIRANDERVGRFCCRVSVRRLG